MKNNLQFVFEFEDSKLLSVFAGKDDKNIDYLEGKLPMDLLIKGNCLIVNSDQQTIDLAKQLFPYLYERMKESQSLERGEIDSSLNYFLSHKEKTDSNQKPYGDLKIHTRKKTITPRSFSQAEYIKTLQESELSISVGPAGTGKTYLAVAVAVSELLAGNVEKIILSRPAVEAGESLGFLPGDMKEKIDPYLRPLYDSLEDMLSADEVDRRIERGQIEIAPLAFMRGRTLKDSYIILDEAQNTTHIQMKMFMTRLGEGSKMVLAGDLSQVDLPKKVKSGLHEAVRVAELTPEIGFHRFKAKDVIRHPLVTKIIDAYKILESE